MTGKTVLTLWRTSLGLPVRNSAPSASLRYITTLVLYCMDTAKRWISRKDLRAAFYAEDETIW